MAQSHIIPEFLYASLYNDDGRMMGITGQGNKGWKLVQKGLREELFCRDCEALLNERYEIPFQQQWTHRYPFPVHAKEGDLVQVQFEYASFKLFHLSVLFRAGVAAQATFSAVSLGRHEEIIRRMILTNDPGRLDQYPMIATPVINARNEIVRGVIAAPTLARVEGHHVYGFVFDGVVWGYSVIDFPPNIHGGWAADRWSHDVLRNTMACVSSISAGGECYEEPAAVSGSCAPLNIPSSVIALL